MTAPFHPFRARRAARSCCAAMLVVAAGATWSAAFSGTAPAAVATPAVIALDVAAPVVGPFDRLRIDLGFRLPATAVPGDRFQITLPPELIPVGPGFDVLDASGATIAVAATSGNKVTFTLTSYVASHATVAGLAYLEAGWDRRTVAPGQAVTLVFDADGTRFSDVVTVGALLPDRDLISVWQGWADERTEDATGPTNSLRWLVGSPRTPSAGAATVRLVATPEAGSAISCSRLGVSESSTLDEFREFTATTVVPAARRVVACTPERIEVTVTGVAPGTWVLVNGRSTVTDSNRSAYGLAGVVSTDAVSTTGAGLALRARSGGNGQGAARSTAAGGGSVAGGAGSASISFGDSSGPDGATQVAGNSVTAGSASADASAGSGASGGGAGDEQVAAASDAVPTADVTTDPATVERLAAAGATPVSRSNGFQFRALVLLGAALAGAALVVARRRSA